MDFNSFKLNTIILSNLRKMHYHHPTPIQAEGIPPILAGRDVMGLAQTGTGKTAAFVLPILQHLSDTQHAKVKALIIAPTRELAEQIHQTIIVLAKGTKIKSVTLYGGVNIRPQIKTLKHGVDIVVACPGRLLDHLKQHTVDLSSVNTLVLDEADQMFDMGFLPDIKSILRYLPKKRQTLLFSATMPHAIHELAQQILHKPIKIKIGETAPATSVKQILFPVPKHLKTELLIQILHQITKDSVLVFTRTKHTAQKVAYRLEHVGFKATSLQGNLSQAKRQIAMKKFREGSLQILVATDIAARGIDVASISHVINYDMPDTVEKYIHRIGRTGRAAKEGEAFTLITPENYSEVRAIEKVLGRKIEQCKLPDFNYAVTPPTRKLMDVATTKSTQHKKYHFNKRKNKNKK